MTINAGRPYAPAGAYIESGGVRSYEVSRTGRIGLGAVLRYLEALATQASASLGFDFRWYEEHGAAWVVREMNVLLAAFPTIGDDLRLATWISDVKRVQAQREYAIWLPHTHRQVALASARWAYIDRARGLPLRLHDELLGKFSVLGNTMPRRAMPITDEQSEVVARGELLLTARDYEADSQQHINNCVYADWLSEGLHLALAPVRDADALVIRPRFYRLEYVRPAQPGDDIRVTTLVSRYRSRALTVHQEIASAQGDLLYVRARSTHLKTAG